MNWKQLYEATTPAQRQEIAWLLLHRIHARQSSTQRTKPIDYFLTIYPKGYHFIGGHHRKDLLALYRGMFMFILATVSLAAWLVALQVRPGYGAPLLFAWSMLLLTVLLIKPYKRVMVQR